MKEKEIITDDDDFVMIERNGQILSGGFHVNSILLKHKQSPMHTINKNFNGGGTNVSDLFKDLAVPSGIFFQPNKNIFPIYPYPYPIKIKKVLWFKVFFNFFSFSICTF
jgi:hypothetical protein